jgi:peroxiredoxin
MAQKHHLEFELLRDEGNFVAGKLGLAYSLPEDLREVYKTLGVDLPRFNGDDTWTLPMPARFLIDGHGIVRKKDVNPDYTVRPEPAETVALLKTLS